MLSALYSFGNPEIPEPAEALSVAIGLYMGRVGVIPVRKALVLCMEKWNTMPHTPKKLHVHQATFYPLLSSPKYGPFACIIRKPKTSCRGTVKGNTFSCIRKLEKNGIVTENGKRTHWAKIRQVRCFFRHLKYI